MRIHLTMLAKSLALAVATIAVFTLSQGVARADEVTISGSTTGTITGIPQLTFVGNPFFTGTTALGVGSLSGANSLGRFSLSTDSLQAVTGTFILHVTFTSPTGILGGPTDSFSADIVGSVSPNIDQGGVNIQFITTGIGRIFNNGTTSGGFDMDVRDFFVQTGRSADLTAGISGHQTSAVPEPATLLLLGTGLTGIAAKLRKRKKAREDNDV